MVDSFRMMMDDLSIKDLLLEYQKKALSEEGREATRPDAGPRVQCLRCMDVIQSMYRWNMVWCGCGDIAIDGGGAYTKMCQEPGARYQFVQEKGGDDDTKDGKPTQPKED
jgi:hypothetical protein